MPVIGFLTSASPRSPYLDDLRQGLAEEGYVDGRNLTIEARGDREGARPHDPGVGHRPRRRADRMTR
jgi:hypothetical protein